VKYDSDVSDIWIDHIKAQYGVTFDNDAEDVNLRIDGNLNGILGEAAIDGEGDYDRDQLTNYMEWIFGTNPTVNDSNGLDMETIVDTQADTITNRVSVFGPGGRKCKIEMSTDLVTWVDSQGPELTGQDAILQWDFIYQTANYPNPIFYRVYIDTSQNSDNDTLTDPEEFLLGTNANLDDTDGDKINDDIEYLHKLDPIVNTDSDRDGLPDDWELYYFGTLDRDGSQNYDNDSDTDLQEFSLGTNPTDYSIATITVSKVGSGTITGGGTFTVGEIVSLEAIPDDGYALLSWSGDVSGISAPDLLNPVLTFTANTDRNLVANFVDSNR